MATEQSTKKKSKKIVSDGIAHIHATFNNTIIETLPIHEYQEVFCMMHTPYGKQSISL